MRFQGLPSISSRCTTAQSTRSFGEDSSSSSEGMSVEQQLANTAHVAATLSTTWERVLQTMERVGLYHKKYYFLKCY